jgi:hypothetical protein
MSVASEYTPQITSMLCQRLHELARNEELAAAEEAAHTPYWAPFPDSVVGHRAAARALRDEIQRLERLAPRFPQAPSAA